MLFQTKLAVFENRASIPIPYRISSILGQITLYTQSCSSILIAYIGSPYPFTPIEIIKFLGSDLLYGQILVLRTF